MADTLQTVLWSLGVENRLSGHLWVPGGKRPFEEVLQEAIRGRGLDDRMRDAFTITMPLWYGLWIDSPLTVEQCSVLRELLTEAVRLEPGIGRDVEEFIRALSEAIGSGEPLTVGLAPPGHVDFGWVTTFPHCPRCKAEAPVPRWQESYSIEPLECPFCGYRYAPAATYSMERALFAESVRCRSCGAEHRVRDFSEDEIDRLEAHRAFEDLVEERGWLLRVEEFYRRHPGVEGRIKPHALMVLESDDPGVREALFAGLPFDRIELPPGGASESASSGDWSKEDREVINYLKHHHFSLTERLGFVEGEIDRLGRELFQATAVTCGVCGGPLS